MLRHMPLLLATTLALACSADKDGSSGDTGTTTGTTDGTDTSDTTGVDMPLDAADTDTDADTDADSDTDTDADADADADTDTDTDTDTGTTTTAVTFANDIGPFLADRCQPCHIGANGSGGFTVNTHGEVVGPIDNATGLAYVAPGDLESSYLWAKLTNTQAAVGGNGSFMPTTGMLPQADLDLVEAWILAGALP